MTPQPIDSQTFRQVLGQFCTGITIITTVHDNIPVGFACQSFAALSLDPPLVLFCPTKLSRSWKAIEATGRFCVNVLTEKQKDISARFGSKEAFVVFGAVQSLSEPPRVKPRPLLFYRGEYTGIEPDKTTPAQWRDDLEAFLTATTADTWL